MKNAVITIIATKIISIQCLVKNDFKLLIDIGLQADNRITFITSKKIPSTHNKARRWPLEFAKGVVLSIETMIINPILVIQNPNFGLVDLFSIRGMIKVVGISKIMTLRIKIQHARPYNISPDNGDEFGMILDPQLGISQKPGWLSERFKVNWASRAIRNPPIRNPIPRILSLLKL
jgi:hypothetical protein